MMSMEADHQRDQTDQRRIDELRQQIEVFLEDLPFNVHEFTRVNLEGALRSLDEDSAMIVRRWA